MRLIGAAVAAGAAVALAAPSATAGASGTMTVEATGRPFVPPAVIDTTQGQVSEPLTDHFCGTCV